MLPCKLSVAAEDADDEGKDNGRRRLLWFQEEIHRRFLAAAPGVDPCASQVSDHRRHQLQKPGRNRASAYRRNEEDEVDNNFVFVSFIFVAGQGGADVCKQHAPAAHIHLRARRLPCLLQRHHHGSRASQGEFLSDCV